MYTDDAERWRDPTPAHWHTKYLRPWTREKTEQRQRLVAEYHRVHAIEHARANSLIRCRFCNGWPDQTKEPIMTSNEQPITYTMPELEAASDLVATLDAAFNTLKH